jgi:hypothetical protein
MTPGAQRVLVAALAGFGAMYGVLSINRSPLLPGVHGDSVEYMSAAESFAQRRTFEVPVADWSDTDSVSVLSHFPPGFPVLIALPLGGETSARAAALWVMAVSAGLAALVVTLLAAEVFGVATGALGTLLLLISPVCVRLHLAIWSEPTYLAVTALLLYAMVRRPRWSWCHGLLAVVGVAIRYVGIAGALAAALWALTNARSWRERLSGFALAIAPSFIFLVWWERLVARGGGAIRRIGVYGEFGRNAQQLEIMLREWLLPRGRAGDPWAAMGTGIVAVVGLVVLIGAARRGLWRGGERPSFLLAAGLFSGCYASVVVLSRFFADPRIPFDDRMFLPVLILVTVAFVASATELARWKGRAGWAVLVVALGVWGGYAVRQARDFVSVVNQVGMYFTFMGWTVDPTLRWVQDDSGAYDAIYSNDPALVYFQTGRHARYLPIVGDDLAAFQRRFQESSAAVVITYPPQVGNLSDDVFTRLLGLRNVVRTERGAAYVRATG